ncbi:YbaB/EbfC family nucleoid-associated protein [Amycolatopsis saalfeldensis]|uniref:YbaB/EbfC DNA-binding family protein n=1 Tax=Amycolatopsis saalfeldensis TaxID=394193 RepID=A0A1H8YJP5_9PSEU|nr:YbaB/EbfC family nucleoid-associated protein [Amycolatopsis saalfeldensis]SEP51628.1 YbaB/EbfC DNA-binding family protein [Amycolatopsis saalfeldensis]
MNETARQLLARIEAIDTAAAENGSRAEAYQHMAGQLKDVQGEATSADGVVTVVAGAGGGITSVTFSERSSATAPEVLSSDVLQAIAEAQASAARLQAEVVARNLGDTELLDRVLASDEELFGSPRPVVVTTVPPPPGRRPAAAVEDDVDELTVFGDREPRP